jgi:cysteinyl-tRNA synthetase
MVRIYNSLTGEKELLQPIEPDRVRMYVCGMTVYDLCHLGHARVMVGFDVVVRYLRSRGFDVEYVRNITDIDDKIIARARELGEDWRELTGRFIRAMHEDAEALGVLAPSREPRATESIPWIIDMVQRLLEKGYAYRASSGDVYYDVSQFERYGCLSGERLSELRSGARVEVDEAKDDPLDFVLWKSTKPGEPAWPSPWGLGRPGWHIECSAMSIGCLGTHFDIHGGGRDLLFPHHENEIAQSQAATGEPFVNVWMHNGFVRVKEEKMSKSLGNFFTVRDILKRYAAEAVRYFIVASHYRSPLNYGTEHLDHARAALSRLYTTLRGLPAAEPGHRVRPFRESFQAAMDDDFNTPEALAVLFDLAHEINRVSEQSPAVAAELGAGLRELGSVLGLLQSDAEVYLQELSVAGVDTMPDRTAVERLVAERDSARNRKDWAQADRLRAELDQLGIALEDGPSGTTWRWKG